jgi:malonyl-CoA/methylmalonyl-CoA synthetase
MAAKPDDKIEDGMADETLWDCFQDTFSKSRTNTAVTFLRRGAKETVISYLDLDRDAHRLANAFLEMGVVKGDRVVFFFDKCLFFVVAHLAVQKLGAVSVPLNPGFKRSEMAYLLGDAKAALVLCGPSQEPMIKEIDPELKTLVIDTQKPYQDLDFLKRPSEIFSLINITPEDPALIIYTSGTTGKPKGAVLTQRNLLHDARNVAQIWEITSSDVLCHALPLFHVHGLCFALHSSLIAGAHVVMLDAFSPEIVIPVLLDKKNLACTVFMAVPSMYARILDTLGDRTLDFSHIRLWTSGSAPLLVRDFERIKKAFGKEPVEREGMSETGMNFSNPLRGAKKPGSIGLPLPGLQVRIVNPDTHKDVNPGETGEIWLKGPAVTPGYWQKPEETAKTFVEGWFRTGDLGRMDDEGYYYLTDRLKHIIISGGENISPKEVESVINRFEGVVESSVIGLPDDQWGEKVAAAVVTKPGLKVKADDLQHFCRQHLHNWKCPKEIILVENLPRNTMGKVLKEELKNLFTHKPARSLFIRLP